jgi:fatty acid desaturase
MNERMRGEAHAGKADFGGEGRPGPTTPEESKMPRLRGGGNAPRGRAGHGTAPEGRRFLRGYDLPADARRLLPSWRETSLPASVGTALADWAMILLVAALHSTLAREVSAAAAAATLPLALVLVARALRGLEVLVHEGSHYNWTRAQRLNDALVNLLAAAPVLQRVEAFRKEHTAHHKGLGGQEDPCRARFYLLEWWRLDRRSLGGYIRGMRGNFWKYSASWWTLVGSNRGVVARGAAWHAVALVLPLGLWLAWGPAGLAGTAGALEIAGMALAAWAAYVAAAFVFVLPPMRFVAEAAKHDYEHGTTTKTGTFSNIGPIHWLLHPHGDGYHFLHHVNASIPHHRLAMAHRWLDGRDEEYASSRRRHHVLEESSLTPEAAG